MKLRNRLTACTIAVALALPLPALAHKAWLLPSATVLPQNSWITVDAAVSNDLFYFNHNPLRLDALAITAPDGSAVPPQNAHTGRYRSVFDVELTQNGTYRLALLNGGLFASWEDNGEPKRWRGTAETFAEQVPKDAKNLQVMQSTGRVETFVTAGTPSTQALAPTGSGLELSATTHPNDLFAGEAAAFTLLLDGKPAANVEVTITAGGTRYRDSQEEMKLTTGADGKFEVTWPNAGMYWLNAMVEDDTHVTPPATKRRAGYVATFEVLPQ